jgi:hypothetical protein
MYSNAQEFLNFHFNIHIHVNDNLFATQFTYALHIERNLKKKKKKKKETQNLFSKSPRLIVQINCPGKWIAHRDIIRSCQPTPGTAWKDTQQAPSATSFSRDSPDSITWTFSRPSGKCSICLYRRKKSSGISCIRSVSGPVFEFEKRAFLREKFWVYRVSKLDHLTLTIQLTIY